MTHPMIALIEQRASANRFDATHALADTEIEELVHLATRGAVRPIPADVVGIGSRSA